MSRGKIGRMSFKEDSKRGSYCGPVVLTAMTGQPYERVEEAFKTLMGMRFVRGTTESSVTSVARFFGMLMYDDVCYQRWARGKLPPTFARWCRERSPKERGMWAVLTCGYGDGRRHFVLVKGSTYWDHTADDGGSRIGKCPYRRCRVYNAIFFVAEAAREIRERWRENSRKKLEGYDREIVRMEERLEKLKVDVEDKKKRLLGLSGLGGVR